MGVPSGPHILKMVNNLNEYHQSKLQSDLDLYVLSESEINNCIKDLMPPEHLPLVEGRKFEVFADPETEEEKANIQASIDTMTEVMKTPPVKYGALMPDTCPAGPIGTIPVGGVVVSTEIHPGMHGADICCSVMATNYGDADPKELLDKVHSITHFGPGGRPNGQRFDVSLKLIDEFRDNPFTNSNKFLQLVREHMGTQGDGNHFAFVGKSEQTGDTYLVTHHGSRGPGAMLYKEGMKIAEKFRRKLSPETLKQNAWIPHDSQEGKDYWDALQLIRKWTKANHFAIHGSTGFKIKDSFWNEHNFVFKLGENFAHAKGATPCHPLLWGEDNSGQCLIPLNMGAPVLIVEPSGAYGFCPHGAGRNLSRTKHRNKKLDYYRGINIGSHIKDNESLRDKFIENNVLVWETGELDIRWYSGNPDLTELPSAYKDANKMIEEIESHNLANIIDKILPYGGIMAGDWEKDAPWRNKKKES